jgi:hypothetical protein
VGEYDDVQTIRDPESGYVWKGLAIASLTLSVASLGMTLNAGSLRAATRLSDDALVCRGGSCTADRFANGSGVTIQADGTMAGVSVQSGAGASLEDLTRTVPHTKVGVSTVGDVRAAGGDVIPRPRKGNELHCEMCGITPEQAESLFTPTVRNPNQ